jgi:hypothetical protein
MQINMSENTIDRSEFRLCPIVFPQIVDAIQSLDWSIVNKTLRVSAKETQSLDVYKWIEFIREKNIEFSKSPFVNIESTTSVLELLGENKKVLCKINFKKLLITEHRCFLCKLIPGAMTHEILFEYNSCEFLVNNI